MEEMKRAKDEIEVETLLKSLDSTEATLTPPSVLPKKHPKRKLLFTGLLMCLVALGCAGAVYYLHVHKQTTTKVAAVKPVKAPVVTKVTPVVTAPVLLTYVNQTKSKDLLITDAQQKTLATLPLPAKKNTFTVLANNGKAVLIEASYITGGPDAASQYYLVTRNGQMTALPAAVTSVLHTITIGGAFLDSKNNYVYVDCSATNCVLHELNLTTAADTVVVSNPYVKTAYRQSSMTLIAVSPADVAYVMLYPTTNSPVAGTLKEISLASKATTVSYPMAAVSLNAPVVAPDYKHLIYTNQADSSTPEIMDLATGKTTAVKSTTPGGATYVWSPDSLKAAFRVNVGPASKVPETLAYVDIAKAQIVSLKTFGDTSNNSVTIDGWVSATQLNYTSFTTTTANDFSASVPMSAAINVTSLAAPTTSLTPAGYTLVSASSF